MKIRHLLVVFAAVAVAGPGIVMAVADFAPAAAQAADEVQVLTWAPSSVNRGGMRKGRPQGVRGLWDILRRDLPVGGSARTDLGGRAKIGREETRLDSRPQMD